MTEPWRRSRPRWWRAAKLGWRWRQRLRSGWEGPTHSGISTVRGPRLCHTKWSHSGIDESFAELELAPSQTAWNFNHDGMWTVAQRESHCGTGPIAHTHNHNWPFAYSCTHVHAHALTHQGGTFNFPILIMQITVKAVMHWSLWFYCWCFPWSSPVPPPNPIHEINHFKEAFSMQ